MNGTICCLLNGRPSPSDQRQNTHVVTGGIRTNPQEYHPFYRLCNFSVFYIAHLFSLFVFRLFGFLKQAAQIPNFLTYFIWQRIILFRSRSITDRSGPKPVVTSSSVIFSTATEVAAYLFKSIDLACISK